MGAPKVKLYMLPPGYSQESDADVQVQRGDELLPCVDRSEDLQDAELLTCVLPVTELALVPVDAVAGLQSCDLVPGGEAVQAPDGVDFSSMLQITAGLLAVVVTDAELQMIPMYDADSPPEDGETAWRFGDAGIEFVGPAPTGATVSFYAKAATPATHWALPNSTPYEGANSSFNQLRASVDGGAYAVVTPESVGEAKPWIETVAASEVKISGAFVTNESRYFIGENPNWIMEHLRMWPDVFVGQKDYPGDTYEQVVNNQVVILDQGPVPEYVEPDTYQLNARDGMVIFPEPLPSGQKPVRALYAHLKGISNVTGQVLDEVEGSDGLRFKAAGEQAFPGSHGKRWVTRDDAFTPINVYVDGQVTPVVQTVVPHDTLTVKLS